ncbi:unnamed protein product [Rotaria sordida]|uniref:Uncharacterized protein n=1 Tax=Rotaria sordida TaxID=392033 RepID=A0A815DSK5_9BILA|nr:unnamed protein product [Rotaria sordida]CAF1575095.1 unnamed protein product [Rotaria sordida]
MENATKQLYAVLYRAVRCCSDVEKFHSELLYIQVSFVTFGCTSEFILSGIQRFYQQFNILEKFWDLRLNNNEYDHLRRCIVEDVEQQIKLKQQREQAKEHTLFMPCPRLMDEESTDAFKQCFEYWWNKYYANESPRNSIQIKWIEQTPTCLTNSNILINRRPPLRLLTLSKHHQNKKRYHPMDPFLTNITRPYYKDE